MRVVIVVRGVPSGRGLMGLHRALGMGLSEVRARIQTGRPLLDAELFRDDHDEVSRVVEAVLEQLAETDHSIHECAGRESPSPTNEVTIEVLRQTLSGLAPEAAGSAPGEPDPALTASIADATRKAITRLRSQASGPFCVYALLTSGEALRPYLSVTLHGPGRWDLADSPFALAGDEFFAPLAQVYDARGDLFDMAPADADAEYWRRLASMEAALHALDDEGFFGVGAERAQTLLLVSPMPPDHSDAGFARRLNPPGELLSAWLDEAAEGYPRASTR
ncbi:DUF4303 domain-containing protein [Microbacterium marinilacus]|nr:DUF4303 domain-containing protein [Microbacterium marinilacus]MBY0688266.1 DUF4303 domain-containing protein [Microbacterium marinilacus]